MFKYEDMDFQSLTTSLDIENPDGPEELYAMAQFCRMGKGTQASEENYRFYLQRAADAGSEQAKQELDALDNADAASAAEPPEEARAVEGMSLPELIQAADNGNPYALLPLAKKAMTKEFLDLPKARQWLEKAAAQVPQGVYGDKDATDIYLLLGGLLKNKQFDTPENRTACHRYYSLAAEMGSGEACDELADQYENGYGCTVDPEKAKFYRDRGAKKNDPVYLCTQCYKMLTENGSRLELVDMLARVRTLTQDQDILGFVDLLSAAGGLGELKPEVAEWAWAQEKNDQIWFSFPGQDKGFCLHKILAETYGTDPQAAIARGLPVDGEKAGLIADWVPTWDRSYPWAKYGAEQNDVIAKSLLGDCYRYGAGVEKNPETAFENYLSAAAAGSFSAMANLADCYRTGFGTSVDVEKCKIWAEGAANEGYAPAMIVLGKLYKGNESVRNYEKARYWLERANEQSHPEAPGLLGNLYDNGFGVPADAAKAAEYFKQGAEKNDAYALFYLGYFYQSGRGVAKDYAKAVEMYQRASELGNSGAMGNLGVLYSTGNGVPKDFAKAAELFQKASDKGNELATANLASLYEKGNGVPQDYDRAFKLYKKAEAMGNCCYVPLCNCYLNGHGTERNFDLALQYAIGAYEKDGVSKEQTGKNLIIIANNAKANDPGYNRVPIYTKAIELGSVDAMLALARMYESGDGVAQDMAKAESCYKDAARAGNKEAEDWLIARMNGTHPAASAPAQTYTDPILQKAADLLKTKTPSEERDRIKLQLSLRENDPEAARLLAALNAQEAEADNVYKDAMAHRAQQKAALEAGNTPLASIEGDTCKRILQEAAASGHAEAAAELDRMQKAEDALQEAEHRLADRSNPDERGNIEALLQQGAACCLPQAIELLNPMLAEDRAAEEKYNEAMDCIRAGGAGDKDKAISLLNECQTVGHKRAADTLSLLKEDYIKQQMLSGGMTRIDAEMQWDSRYAQSEQELFSRANALLNGGNDPAEREHVEKLLQMRSANPEAKRLLDALHDRDSNAQRELDEARRCLQTAAESKKPADAEAERQKAIDLLQSAAAKGSTDAQDELAHVQNGPALLTEAEKVMVSRRKPGMRAKAREMLEKADGCGLPRVTELLNMLQREETEAQTNYQNALTLLNTDSADNRRHAISLLKQNANAGFTQSADLLKQIGVGQPSANNRTAPDPEPIYSSSTQDDSTMLSDDREALGEKLAGGVLLFVVAEVLGSVLANIPVVGFVLSTLCTIAALIGIVIGGYASVQIHLVHHIPLSDPDMRRGYYKAPAMLGNLLLSLFTKKK
jgi:TPR repeat protein